jgi:asparagine synthase (glutamine-hydrolysing)
MRQGMQGILPPVIQWREDKGHLNMALDSSIRKFEKPLLRRLRESEIKKISKYTSTGFLEEAVSDYLEGKIGSGGRTSRDGTVVWRALSLGLWLKNLEESPSRG